MKKAFLFAASAAVLCSCSTQPKYVVEGDIAGLEGTVYLFQQDSLIDSAVVKSGKFRFSGPAGAPAMHDLLDSRDGQPQAFAMQLILEPGTISIKSDADDPQVRHTTGTPANDAAEAYTAASRALITEYRDAATTDQRREAIEEEFEQPDPHLGRGQPRQLLRRHADAQHGLRGFRGRRFSTRSPNSRPKCSRPKSLTELKATAEQKKRTDVGQPYINILQSDAEGQIVTLTSVIENPANKYTLVDFWASWCGPCMGEVPHLKETYDKFHKKGFEIYGVSFDNNRDKWLAAVKDNGMKWIQVSDLNGFDNPAAKDYAVQGIPSNFLIDASGNIVAKNLRGEDLYKKVEEPARQITTAV
ncbi:MAG: thioredoxin-like domain-containing protein [Alistipes finegoldii]